MTGRLGGTCSFPATPRPTAGTPHGCSNRPAPPAIRFRCSAAVRSPRRPPSSHPGSCRSPGSGKACRVTVRFWPDCTAWASPIIARGGSRRRSPSWAGSSRTSNPRWSKAWPSTGWAREDEARLHPPRPCDRWYEGGFLRTALGRRLYDPRLATFHWDHSPWPHSRRILRREAGVADRGPRPHQVHPLRRLQRPHALADLGEQAQADTPNSRPPVCRLVPEDAAVWPRPRLGPRRQLGHAEEQAKADYDRASRLEPGDAATWIEHGRFLAERGRAQADSAYTRAAARAPDELNRFPRSRLVAASRPLPRRRAAHQHALPARSWRPDPSKAALPAVGSRPVEMAIGPGRHVWPGRSRPRLPGYQSNRPTP